MWLTKLIRQQKTIRTYSLVPSKSDHNRNILTNIICDHNLPIQNQSKGQITWGMKQELFNVSTRVGSEQAGIGRRAQCHMIF